jgi:hypothetical protein
LLLLLLLLLLPLALLPGATPAPPLLLLLLLPAAGHNMSEAAAIACPTNRPTAVDALPPTTFCCSRSLLQLAVDTPLLLVLPAPSDARRVGLAASVAVVAVLLLPARLA